MKYCKFHFSKGKKCKFENKCKFIHDKNILIPCEHFMNKERNCTKGKECWYLHLVTEEDISKCVVEMKNEFNQKISSLICENLELRQRIDVCESNQKTHQHLFDNSTDSFENTLLNKKQSRGNLETPISDEKEEKTVVENKSEIEE